MSIIEMDCGNIHEDARAAFHISVHHRREGRGFPVHVRVSNEAGTVAIAGVVFFFNSVADLEEFAAQIYNQTEEQVYAYEQREVLC
jgi:hypothetical protein